MGFLSNCNFFTESDFDDYRRLDKVLNEADDDDLNDDESESNFDMPDDDEGGDDNTDTGEPTTQSADNGADTQAVQIPDNGVQTQDAGGGENELGDQEGESDFDLQIGRAHV